MASLYNRRPGAQKKTTESAILNRALSRSKVQTQVPFLKENKVPAGTYIATIASISEAITQNGDEALDVVYKLCDSNGRTLDAKERLVLDSRPYNLLIDHLIDADLLSEGAVLADMVGICEEVTVVYPYKGAFGSFKDRQPCQQKAAVSRKEKKQDLLAEDPDDEFDDFLEEDD